MARRRSRKSQRVRIGQVSYYEHHGGWFLYYRDGNRQVRRRVADTPHEAAVLAAQLNAQLSSGVAPAQDFQPISVAELRRKFLDHHEHVLCSSVATVRRYETAARHLEDFCRKQTCRMSAHEVVADDFIRYLRSLRIAPNGHPNTPRRPLRDKGVRYILEVCRGMYGFAGKRRHLPPYAENPFADLNGKRIKIQDAKPVFVFDQQTEPEFLKSADSWSFPIHFTLAKTGIRPGELVHLLIEEVDLQHGWLYVRNKPDLGWRIKTGRDRKIPLLSEVAAVLEHAIGNRTAGVVFVRPSAAAATCPLWGLAQIELAKAYQRSIRARERDVGREPSRREEARLAGQLWNATGAVRIDAIRNSFIRVAKRIGHNESTCPKSWRHTFATLLQDANVDPLVRQITLGHAPSFGNPGALGMTSVYTHTRPETQRAEIERALRLWPQSLELGRTWAQGGVT